VILALVGGIGGAKLALGLSRLIEPAGLAIVVNTGDDFEHLGLHVSPDLDTVMYTLAGIANPQTGWGRAGDTWSVMDAMEALGGETWFRLGDRDLAINLERTAALRAGDTLSAVTARLASALGVRHTLLPMSDDPVRTVVVSAGQRYAFQHYFVRLRCEPKLDSILFEGADRARAAPRLRALMGSGDIEGIVIGPSNPFLSVDPILAVPEIAAFVGSRRFPVVAVSPIVGGQAIKGPAAKIFRERGELPTALGVARHYLGTIDGLLIDRVDEPLAQAIEALDIAVATGDTVMHDLADRERVARDALALLRQLREAVDVRQ
jgi:LPPG:FO 2-phospho-L-lactate transferase